jgi:two-component system response regulator AlgR
MKILIVDDEGPARERLKALLREIEPDHALHEADNGLTALIAADREKPDIVLMDIRMPGMDGLEAAYHLTSFNPQPAVIFTTAYQDHAIQAFEANAVDYLLKPIRRDRLVEALDRAEVINRARLNDISQEASGCYPRTHLVSTGRGKIELIPVEEITYLKAEQKYITAGWRGREMLVDEPLKSLESEFNNLFLRIHRNALVSMDHVRGLEKNPDGSFSILVKEMDGGLTVSRRHLHAVRKFVKGIQG